MLSKGFFQGYNFVVEINIHSYLFIITVVFLKILKISLIKSQIQQYSVKLFS